MECSYIWLLFDDSTLEQMQDEYILNMLCYIQYKLLNLKSTK